METSWCRVHIKHFFWGIKSRKLSISLINTMGHCTISSHSKNVIYRNLFWAYKHEWRPTYWTPNWASYTQNNLKNSRFWWYAVRLKMREIFAVIGLTHGSRVSTKWSSEFKRASFHTFDDKSNRTTASKWCLVLSSHILEQPLWGFITFITTSQRSSSSWKGGFH